MDYLLTHQVPRRASPQILQRVSSSGSVHRSAESASKPAGRPDTPILKGSKNRYPYRPLPEDSTRLLVLQPVHTPDARTRTNRNEREFSVPNASPENPKCIFVDIVEVPFEDLGSKYKYEALSYHWGFGRPKWRIQVRNDYNPTTDPVPQINTLEDLSKVSKKYLGEMSLWVREELYSALTHIRRDEPAILWIDAICIDQENHLERQHQVGMMNQIFSRANTVLIWLGAGDELVQKGMDFVKEVNRLDDLKALVNTNRRLPDWYNLFQLMRCVWFSRRWVIQELALAQQAVVLYGEKEVNWVDVRDAISLFDLNFDKIRRQFRQSKEFNHDFNVLGELESVKAKHLVDAINNIFRKKDFPAFCDGGDDFEFVDTEALAAAESEPIQSLEYLVSALSSFEASDPRDTIQALRNIAKETYWARKPDSSTVAPPLPDYEKNLLEVYTDFIKWIVGNTGCIDLLCRHWAIPERSDDGDGFKRVVLPSWIQCNDEGPIGGQGIQQLSSSGGRISGDSFVGLPHQSAYKASMNTKAKIRFGNEGYFVQQRSPEQSRASTSNEPHKSRVMEPNVTSFARTNNSDCSNRLHHDKGACAFDDQNWKDVKEDRNKRTTAPDSQSESMVNSFDDRMEGNLKVTDKLRETVIANGEPDSGPGTAQGESKSVTSNLGHSVTFGPISLSRTTGLSSYLGSTWSMASPEDRREQSRRVKQHREGLINAMIHVNGIAIGKVSWYADCREALIPNTVLEKLRGNERTDPAPEKLWRTLVAERGADGRNPPTWYYRACCYCMDQISRSGNLNISQIIEKSPPDIVHMFLKRVQSVVWNRRFIEIEIQSNGVREELHGIGPGRLERDDIVCILFGCSVPVILRPCVDDHFGEYYTFIGEAYIYGLMDGEVISKMNKSQRERKGEGGQTFSIL